METDRIEEERVAQRRNLLKRAYLSKKDDGEVHRDDVFDALRIVGFALPDEACVEQAFLQASDKGRGALDEEQFYEFVDTYSELFDKVLRKAFASYDSDSSGYISGQELAELLSSYGIEPMRHVLEEIIVECDEDGEGNLNYDEFKSLMEIVRTREGFAKSECDTILELFQRCDRDGSGEISVQEMDTLLAWLGYSVEKEDTDKIIQEVDINGNGSISSEELLLCMRKVRELELQKLRTFVASIDTDRSGTISNIELPHALRSLGFYPDMEAVNEAAVEIGFHDKEYELDLSAMWRLLTMYRSREGLRKAEASEINEAFKKFDRDGEGEIDSLDVGKVLRWMGYATTYELMQQLVAQVDVDGTGKLSPPEMRKFVRLLQARDSKAARDLFLTHLLGDSKLMTLDQALTALKSLGSTDPAKESNKPLLEPMSMIPHAVESGGRYCLGWDGFVAVAIMFHRQQRRVFRANGGFTEEDIAELRTKFSQYDRDNSGDIGRKELIALIEDVFPDMASDPKMRPTIAELLKSIDVDGTGSLNFREFVLFMDRFREVEQKEKLEKERRMIERTGFSSREVEDFRELFLGSSEGHNLITGHSIHKMLKDVLPLGHQNTASLNLIVLEVSGRPDDSNGGELDFPDFLILMSRLLATNFANINKQG